MITQILYGIIITGFIVFLLGSRGYKDGDKEE